MRTEGFAIKPSFLSHTSNGGQSTLSLWGPLLPRLAGHPIHGWKLRHRSDPERTIRNDLRGLKKVLLRK